MRNLVADLIVLNGHLPRRTTLIQHECQTMSETQPEILRIVQAPRTAMPPFIVRSSQPNSIPAGLAYLRFQLSPCQNEVGLLVQPLLASDAITLGHLACCIVSVAQLVKKVVDLCIQFRDRLQIPH